MKYTFLILIATAKKVLFIVTKSISFRYIIDGFILYRNYSEMIYTILISSRILVTAHLFSWTNGNSWSFSGFGELVSVPWDTFVACNY